MNKQINNECPICGRELKGVGNNADPLPLANVCDECNTKLIIPLRLAIPTDKYAILFKTTGKISFHKPKGEKFTLEELQAFVGGYIETYPTQVFGDNYVAFVNEEGLLIGLDYNYTAHHLLNLECVGNIVFVPTCMVD